MTEYRGIATSPGIAIGTVYLHREDTLAIPQYQITPDELDAEIGRLAHAVGRAGDDIESLKGGRGADLAADEEAVLNTHLLMLRDPGFLDSVHGRLRQELHNIEWILFQSVKDLTEKLAQAADPYLRERTADLHDVSRRILSHLLDRQRTTLAELDKEVIVVAHDLLPSEAVAMNKRMVRGIALDGGGKTSHTAILARSFEIPAVLGLSEISRTVRHGDTIVVDGNRGRVIVNPDSATISRYAAMISEWQAHEVDLMRLNSLTAETPDGKLILLKGNIEVPEEVDAVHAHGADGIGLYRSEFLFLRSESLPTEEEQYVAYRGVLEAMGSKPVTIRTIDLGGDKFSKSLDLGQESNPILGWRAIRVCLSELELFRTQLRALLRASVHGHLRIMFPMISGIQELNRALEVVDEVKSELRERGRPFDQHIPMGIMVEVPSAALTSDILARKADFFSIGTNDLIQYTIAVDRGNEKIAYLYEPFHLGVLRLIKMVIDNAHAEGIPVAMCGEMAGDPLATLVLLGLGLDEFSMSAVGIPEVKRIVRGVAFTDAEELAGLIMEMRSATEIEALVREHLKTRFDLDLYS